MSMTRNNNGPIWPRERMMGPKDPVYSEPGPLARSRAQRRQEQTAARMLTDRSQRSCLSRASYQGMRTRALTSSSCFRTSNTASCRPPRGTSRVFARMPVVSRRSSSSKGGRVPRAEMQEATRAKLVPHSLQNLAR